MTMQRSPGPVRAIASTDWRVKNLVAAALRLYTKVGRQSASTTLQFSLEGLDPKEKLIDEGTSSSVSILLLLLLLLLLQRHTISSASEILRRPHLWLRFMNCWRQNPHKELRARIAKERIAQLGPPHTINHLRQRGMHSIHMFSLPPSLQLLGAVAYRPFISARPRHAM
ncbi:hypothetical protein OPV22_020245 [Ensete ventricosum]|uniref:DUF7054 domain-containing protein n=1 Tax=Ensete ventricosum TaxID=4639 RepID=A0AAV8QPK4_ENSVE|nr:hypothetical protein OPV22_020245 [Ensete ventricosum]